MRVGSSSVARMTLVLLPAAVWLGCGGGTAPNLVDVSGTWQYAEQFTDQLHNATCTDSGTYSIAQAADGFTGIYFQRGVCRGPFGVVDNTDSGSVTEGHVVGRTLRFKAPNCQYEGVKADNMEELDGQVVCTVGDQSVTYNFSGTWSAHR
jgi:hypothetical protein